MKCLCGFQQKPDNLEILKNHVRACKKIQKSEEKVFAVWRDAEFTIVLKTEKNEKTFPLETPQPLNSINYSGLGIDGVLPPVKAPDMPLESIKEAEEEENKPTKKKSAPKKKTTKK